MKLSVCITTYNHEQYIAQAIDSVLMQRTNFDYEIIIGEDDSSDRTRDIVKKYAEKYTEKIRLFLNDRKNVIYIDGQPTGRWNFTNNLKHARGNYVALLDGDDYWTDPYKLQKQVDFFEANKDVVLCFTRFKTENKNTTTFEEDKNGIYFDNNASYIEFDFEKFYTGWHIGTQTVMFRNEYLKSYDDSIYKYYRDIYLYTHFLLSGKCVCLNFFGAVYRKHDGGVYTGASEIRKLKIGYLAYKELYHKNKHVYYLKLKKIKYTHYYIATLLKNNCNRVASKILVQNFFVDYDLNYFIKIIKKIARSKIKHYLNKLSSKFTLKKLQLPDFYKPVTSLGVMEIKREEKIIVSLTSYPARINTVHLTINTLLCQTLKPDMLILWLAVEQFPQKEKELPLNLIRLKKYGLTIKWCSNLKSYTKLIPALKEFPTDIIVTADDDIFYPKDWLRLLYLSYRKQPYFIHCHRCHRILIDENQLILPYTKWEYETKNNTPSYLNFLTGCGGVLYKSSHLYKDILSVGLFTKLSPAADDIWFWAMAVLNNTKIKVIENSISSIQTIEGTQNDALGKLNWIEGENDRQLENVFNYYKGLREKILQEKELK